MNLFWLDIDPTLAARAHQDVHVGVGLKEAVQGLCAAFDEPHTNLRFADGLILPWKACEPTARLAADLLPYARTKSQYNHPIALWVRASRGNFDAAIALAKALAAEYRHREGKPHASEAALDWVVRHRAEAQAPDGPMTPYALVMPAKYVPALMDPAQNWIEAVCVAAYRAYYRAEKRGFWRKSRDPAKPPVWVPAKWTKREVPDWFGSAGDGQK